MHIRLMGTRPAGGGSGKPGCRVRPQLRHARLNPILAVR